MNVATRRISIAEYLDNQHDLTLFDVRTPAEFEKGHIPGAQNLPLFSNEERAEVGTLYKQVSPKSAFLKGLELVGPKMRWLVERAEQLARSSKVAVHCWRGGQRSYSVGWLLSLAGFEMVTIEGGYKAYRTHILQEMESGSWPFIVLGGKTGARKTEILHQIRTMGEQVLDLEGLANHKGSAFGALGLEEQPSVEHFDNLLYSELCKFDKARRIWVENESKSIGRVYLHAGVWRCMQRSPMIELEIPLEQRIDHLVEIYGQFPGDMLKEAFLKIKKRLGGQHLKAALEAIDKNDLATAAGIALRYYDKAYTYHRKHKRTEKAGQVISFEPDHFSLEQISRALVGLANKEQL
jgi:tRNA 2-selenouridine synthase